jgi:hypothetical protein
VATLGGACTTDAGCEVGSSCLGGVCLVPDGAACGWDAACQVGSSCDHGVCTPCPGGVCVFEGGACDFSAQCANGISCVDGVCAGWCGLDLVTCDPAGPSCCDGLSCQPDGAGVNRCHVTVGGLCGSDEVCAAGSSCAMAQDGWYRCLTDWGGACHDGSECVAGASCIEGVCGMCKGAGTSCSQSSDCCGGGCFLGTCRRALPPQLR